MSRAPTPSDEEMPTEIDFSGGTRGQLYRPGVTLSLPADREAPVQSRLVTIANRPDIEPIEKAK